MIQPAALIIYDADRPTRNFFFFAGVSFFCHLLIFLMVALVHQPGDFSRKIEPPPAIDVDLVAFNPETPLPPARMARTRPAPRVSAPASVPTPAPEPAAAPDPPLVSVKEGLQKKKKSAHSVVEKPKARDTKPAVKKPAAKKQIDSAKVIEEAVKRIEAESQASQAKPVSDRIASLRKEVLEPPSGSATAKSSAASSGNAYPRDFTQIEIFQAEVSVRLKNNWVFSEKLAGETEGLESRLVIKILPDGSITDIWFEKRSGNAYLDESAYKTVMKSNPLPPLPAGIPYYHLVLGFTPSGLHQD